MLCPILKALLPCLANFYLPSTYASKPLCNKLFCGLCGHFWFFFYAPTPVWTDSIKYPVHHDVFWIIGFIYLSITCWVSPGNCVLFTFLVLQGQCSGRQGGEGLQMSSGKQLEINISIKYFNDVETWDPSLGQAENLALRLNRLKIQWRDKGRGDLSRLSKSCQCVKFPLDGGSEFWTWSQTVWNLVGLRP